MTSIKENLSANINPAPNNDASQGYDVGSEWFNVSTGCMWKCLDATVGVAVWIPVKTNYPAWPVGYYRVPRNLSFVSNSDAITADLLTMQQIVVEDRVMIDRLAMRVVSTQPEAAARLGLYRSDPETGLPSTLVVDGGELNLSDFTGDRWRTVNEELLPGIYWTACIMKSVGTMPVVRRNGGSTYGHVARDVLDELGSDSAYRYLSANQAFGALPANAPAMSFGTGIHGPVVALRRSQ